MKCFSNGMTFRSCIKDVGSILDLFGTGVTSVRRGTLADDVQSVYRDFEEVGADFASILSSEERPASSK
jgi:hypothetical protein